MRAPRQLLWIVLLLASPLLAQERKATLIWGGEKDLKPPVLSLREGVAVERSREHVKSGQYSVRVAFAKWDEGQQQWPAIFIYAKGDSPLPRDWRAYDDLVLDVYNPQEEDVSVNTYVTDDTPAQKGNPRAYQARHTLPPKRWTEIRCPIPDMKQVADLDMAKVHGLALWTTRPAKAYRLFIDDIRLETVPLRVLSLSFDRPFFTPNGDGFTDDVIVRGRLSRPATMKVEFFGPQGQWTPTATRQGETFELTYTGGPEEPAAEGLHTCHLSARDAVFNRAVIETQTVKAAPSFRPDQYLVWVALPVEKVRRDDLPDNLLTRVGQPNVELWAARGEKEPVQILLRPIVDLKSVEVAAPDIRAGEATIGCEVRRAGYVETKRPSKDGHGRRPGTKTGWYPDPLMPLSGPFDAPVDEGNQVIWITYDIPRSAKPGTYQSCIRIRPANGRGTEIPATIHVWPFELPLTPSLPTAFGINRWGDFHKWEDIKAKTPEEQALYEKYYELLVSHRLSPYAPPYPIDDPRADRFLDDIRVTTFRLPFSVPFDTDKHDEGRLKELCALLPKIREKGWLSKAYLYTMDEPMEDQYPRVVEMSKKVHAAAPDVRVLLTEQPEPALDGWVDIWCPQLHNFDPEACKRQQQKGRAVWWYHCECDPEWEYPTYLIDRPAVEHRVIPWATRLYGVQGHLYWCTNYWHKGGNPWENALSWERLNGAGMLIYPGHPVGVDGPVPSLRFELVREGMEDYEYFVLLDRLAGRDACIPFIQRVIRGITDYTIDPGAFMAARRELGCAIADRMEEP